ncbi:branched-chain amino acid ABC transporter permease [Kaistia dalseonensis]|uniref:Branched-chain amino acid transport system permease protein n=1 Tax=Kaistia dalseonensis TaxID=410840 RepID=A0ABU0H384_9HYPH|nr:branched-chain amino acid ABC transporter permease [Kaistia dalseonensis]MCX5493383.1 branched-chain amino acid ABC transporter permease [Kaistia dalseonensis]MDQ0435941.1 branched-chain amino acid transport system permease protein [Kaistia dalseonensis]
MDIFNPVFWIFVATTGGIYTIMALGLYVQFSLAGLPNFGHVAFMAVAAYAMAILVARYGLPLPVGILGGLVAAVILAILVGVPALRLRADYLAIATVAGGEIVRYLAMNLQGLTGGPIGSIGLLGPGKIATFNGSWQVFMGDIAFYLKPIFGKYGRPDTAMAIVVWVFAFAAILVLWRMERSPWGRVMQGIREDDTAVAAIGKNVVGFKMQALIIGALLGAVSGMLLALQIGVFSPDDYQPTITFYAYLIIILGGMNRIWSVPVGAILFTLLYTGTRFLNVYPLTLFDSGERAYLRLFLVGLLLVLFLAFRPQGIFGDRRQILEK